MIVRTVYLCSGGSCAAGIWVVMIGSGFNVLKMLVPMPVYISFVALNVAIVLWMRNGGVILCVVCLGGLMGYLFDLKHTVHIAGLVAMLQFGSFITMDWRVDCKWIAAIVKILIKPFVRSLEAVIASKIAHTRKILISAPMLIANASRGNVEMLQSVFSEKKGVGVIGQGPTRTLPWVSHPLLTPIPDQLVSKPTLTGIYAEFAETFTGVEAANLGLTKSISVPIWPRMYDVYHEHNPMGGSIYYDRVWLNKSIYNGTTHLFKEVFYSDEPVIPKKVCLDLNQVDWGKRSGGLDFVQGKYLVPESIEAQIWGGPKLVKASILRGQSMIYESVFGAGKYKTFNVGYLIIEYMNRHARARLIIDCMSNRAYLFCPYQPFESHVINAMMDVRWWKDGVRMKEVSRLMNMTCVHNGSGTTMILREVNLNVYAWTPKGVAIPKINYYASAAFEPLLPLPGNNIRIG